MTKIAYSYTRISSADQKKGTGIARQLALSRKYCDENNWILRENILDVGISGYTGKNFNESAGLGSFIHALKNKLIPSPENVVLIIEDWDRFSRLSPIQQFTKLSEVLSYGISILTLNDRQLYSLESMGNDCSQLFIAIGTMQRAHQESSRRSKMITSAYLNKITKMPLGAQSHTTPSWISRDCDKGFLIKPGAKETILKVYDLSINENMGHKAICKWLNDHSQEYPHFKSGDKWNTSMVRQILNSPSLYGLHQPKLKGRAIGPALENYYPAIIDKSRYLLSQSLIKIRRDKGGGRRGNQLFQNIFTKLLTCQHCHSSIRFLDNSHGRQYYVCSAAHLKVNDCQFYYWKRQDFERLFFSKIREIDFSTLTDKDNDQHQLITINEEIRILKEEYQRCITLSIKAKDNDIRQTAYQREMVAIETKLTTLMGSKLTLETSIAKLNHQPQDIISILNSDNTPSTRRKLNALISQSCTKIQLYSPKIRTVPEWEILDLVDDIAMPFLLKKFKNNITNIEMWLCNNRFGQGWLSEHLRSIHILFSNEQLGWRVCVDSRNSSYAHRAK